MQIFCVCIRSYDTREVIIMDWDEGNDMKVYGIIYYLLTKCIIYACLLSPLSSTSGFT